MAQQDKTDFYWNGVLSGAVNNLYYDLINVDVCHVPYATTHRNSSFFLKTRLGYIVEEKWNTWRTQGYSVKDVHIVRDSGKENLQCDDMSGTVYVLAQKNATKKIFYATISNGCISGNFSSKTEWETSFIDYCSDWKLLVTNFVKGEKTDMGPDIWTETGDPHAKKTETSVSGIQMNKYTLGTTTGLFSDVNVESGYYDFDGPITQAGNYLLVYYSRNGEKDGFAGQVRMITGTEQYGGVSRIVVDSPRLGFKVPDASQFEEGEEKIVEGGGLKYAVFTDWGEVIGFTDKHEIYLIYNNTENDVISVYNQYSDLGHADIIGVASSNEKIFVLTDNGYIHFNNGSGGYNKFFIQDDMFAGTDKIAITSYRDMVVTFGRQSISVGVPDDNNRFYTMYNQNNVKGIRSRYAFEEYEGDLLYVSSDRRLMALGIAGNVGRYMLQAEDVGDMINGKLATMLYYDEVSIGATDDGLRIFVNTMSNPYVNTSDDMHATPAAPQNDITHIYKFNTLFKVWTEDHVDNLLITGVKDGIYFGEQGLFKRDVDSNGEYGVDYDGTEYSPYEAIINAYLIENENNGLENHPLLFQLAKLNRLITTLGPGIYSNNSKIKIELHTKGVGLEYSFPLSGDNNNWLGMITDMYTGQHTTIDSCVLETVKQDGQEQIEVDCGWTHLTPKILIPETPWCDSYKENLIQDHGICYNNRMYRLAPTIPLVTSLGENQSYSTEIKIELIGGRGDVICFGGRLAELFLAPLFMTGPDGEYQLQPQTDC